MSALPNSPSSGFSKDAVAKKLADAHRAADPAIVGIYRIELPGQEANPAEPVKLLEVTPNTTVSGIMPVRLSADAPSGILFPSIIVEIHTTEWEQLRRGRLSLPHGWTFNPHQPL